MGTNRTLCSLCRQLWMLGVKVLAFILNMLTFAQQINKLYSFTGNELSRFGCHSTAQGYECGYCMLSTASVRAEMLFTKFWPLTFIILSCDSTPSRFSFWIKLNWNNRIIMGITMPVLCLLTHNLFWRWMFSIVFVMQWNLIRNQKWVLIIRFSHQTYR